MARPKQVNATVNTNLRVSEHTYTRLVGHLLSEVEGRIPYGALQEFVEPLITAELDRLYGKDTEQ